MSEPVWKLIARDEGNQVLQPEKYAWAVPELIEMARQSWCLDRLGVMHALAYLGPTASSAVPTLRENLRDKEPIIRVASADALRCVEGISFDALHVLEREIEGPNSDYAADCIKWVAKQISSSPQESETYQKNFPEVSRILGIMCKYKGEYYVRLRAAQGLALFGKRARSALPLLRGLLNDENESVRKAAQEAIAKLEG